MLLDEWYWTLDRPPLGNFKRSECDFSRSNSASKPSQTLLDSDVDDVSVSCAAAAAGHGGKIHLESREPDSKLIPIELINLIH